jgi:hypothetical protein
MLPGELKTRSAKIVSKNLTRAAVKWFQQSAGLKVAREIAISESANAST